MRNFFKNMDLEMVKDQIADIKGQVQDLHIQKPWTTGSSRSPLAYMAMGGAIVALGIALYKNREEVASFCSNCSSDLKDKWQGSGMKGKAGDILGKVKSASKEATKGSGMDHQEHYQPT